MPQGLQTFSEDGEILLDYTTRTGRFLGEFTTDGGKSGSIQDDRLIDNGLVVWPVETLDLFFGADITFSPLSGTIFWEFNMEAEGSAGIPDYPEKKIYYGIY